MGSLPTPTHPRITHGLAGGFSEKLAGTHAGGSVPPQMDVDPRSPTRRKRLLSEIRSDMDDDNCFYNDSEGNKCSGVATKRIYNWKRHYESVHGVEVTDDIGPASKLHRFICYSTCTTVLFLTLVLVSPR